MTDSLRRDLGAWIEGAHRKTMCVLLALVGFSIVSATGMVAVFGQDGGMCVDATVQAALNDCPETLTSARTVERGAGVLTHLQEARRREQPTEDAGTRGPSVELDLSARMNREGIQARAWDLLQREERILKRLVGNTERNDPRRPDVLLRLAETYFEMQQVLNARVRGFDEPIHQACRVEQNANRCQQLREQQQQAQAALDEKRNEAVRAYATLVNDHEDYSRMDEVLFSLAFGLDELGDHERGRRVYRRLIKNHPNSRFVPHAYLSFAEFYFNDGEMDSAITFYSKVREFPPERNPVHGFAIYKSAWAHYNLENWRESLQAFVDTIDFATQNPDAPDAANLARQSRRELVLPYAQNGTPQRALEFFQRYARNREEALEMLESLGELYTDTGQWNETISVYHRLMEEQSASNQICYWQWRVTNAVISSRPKADQVTEMTRLVDIWETFQNQGNRPAETVTQCKEYSAGILVWLATAWHREAIGTESQPGTNDRNTMQVAARLYRLLLEKFPDMEELEFSDIDRRDWPTQYRVQYYYAELLWKMEDYPGCAREFDRVVELDPRGEYTNDAADGSVICYDRLYQTQFREREHQTRTEARGTGRGRGRQQAEPAAPTFEPRELTELESGMLQAFRRYVCVVEDSENLVRVKYQRARVYYEANRFEEAAVLFRDIAWNHQDSDVAEFAANLYLDSLNILGSRREPPRLACLNDMNESVEPLTRFYCSNDADRATHSEVCSTVRQLECDFERLRAEGLSRTGDHKRSGSAYVGIYRRMPECGERASQNNPERYPTADDYLAEVLWNAAIEFERAHLIGQAITVRNVLIDTYPDTTPAKRAIYLVGANFHALASYERAAQYFERFARDYSGEDGSDCTDAERAEGICAIAHEALRNALVFRMGLGTEHEEQAIDNAELFARNYRRRFPQETSQAAFAIGEIYERRQDWSGVTRHYQNYLRQYRRDALPHQIIQANVRIGRAHWNQDDKRQARRFFEDAVQAWNGGAAEAIAQLPGDDSQREDWLRDAKDAASEALFYLAEYRYEEFIDIGFPTYRGARNIESVNSWGQEEFGPWLERKRTALLAAAEDYNRVAALEVPAWMIASAARIGEMYISVVDQAEEAPVPREIQDDPELYDIYIQTLLEVTEPLRVQAVDRFEFCLLTSTNVRWFNDWSRTCESELNRLNPREYPEAVELRSGATLRRHTFSRPGSVDLDAANAEEQAPGSGGES